MLPYLRIRVIGPSMAPAVRNGEWWLVRRTRRVRRGDVVLLVHPRRPDALVVKRVIRRDPHGWWVEGDNASMSDDSRQFGAVAPDLIVGRLTLRYSPLRRRG